MRIHRATVDRGSCKVTKTRGSTRIIELLDGAREALERQWPIAWILSQTGHTSETIFRQSYARWLHCDSKTDCEP